MADPVTDLRDTRVLIPRIRRAVQGPHASGSGVVANEFSDDEINAMGADAIADVILYSGGANIFGHTLEVAARDDFYMAPSAWRTDTELTEPEGSVIAAQAALRHFGDMLKTLKTSEKIADEGQDWEYTIAASVLTEQIKGLRADRDRALEILVGQHAVTEDYINFLSVRDAMTDQLIEPWSQSSGVGGQRLDPRGFW